MKKCSMKYENPPAVTEEGKRHRFHFPKVALILIIWKNKRVSELLRLLNESPLKQVKGLWRLEEDLNLRPSG